MPTDAQVLGITSPPPVAGSPLVTPEMITAYLLTFLIGIVVLYVIFHIVKKPLLLSHKIKLVLLVSIILKISLVLTVGMLAVFYLLPTPKVTNSYPMPSEKTGNYPLIEIEFDRPINRNTIKKEITPETPGVWTFESPLYATHLYRRVVFHPTVTLKPSTTYTIKISNISNFLKLSKPDKYTYSFTTLPSPNIESVSPSSGTRGVEINAPIIIKLTGKNEMRTLFEFTTSPKVDFKTTLSQDKTFYTITPITPFSQGVTYTLSGTKTDVTHNVSTNTVVERGNTISSLNTSFTTKEAPGITNFIPTGEKVLTNEKISITFSQPMDRPSVESNFIIEPKIPGTFTWADDASAVFKPESLAYETAYTMTIPRNTKDKSGGYIPQDVTKTFSTIGSVKADSISPQNGLKAIGINNIVSVTFDQEVVQKSAESKFSINPSIPGNFSWNKNTLTFTPSIPYAYSTLYTVVVANGVESIEGLSSTAIFTTQFTTQEQTIKLQVPTYLQKYSLSCEIASLRMALEFKGVTLSEDKILEEVGFDNTPNSGGTWGNPHSAFVGNVNGRQMVTGYGVYWEPIARVARSYRNATDFRNWKISDLTKALSENNPVIIWTYSSNGAPTVWNTLTGFLVNAIRGEHAVVAVGYIGDKNNPSTIIVNDPLYGQVHWPREFFEKKWSVFGQSGVVIY